MICGSPFFCNLSGHAVWYRLLALLANVFGASISVFAPESFEYLILKSGLIEVPKAILEETWDYADSVSYFSWEEFYRKV